MATLYTHQESNIAKTWALMAGFLVFVIAIGFALSWYFDDQFILYIAVIFSFIANIASYWYSDKLALSMSGARPVTREEMPDLWNIVENLSITAGLPMPRLHVIDDPAPNAFATGRNKEHSAVAVTTGLLQILDRSELEGVLAHELSHVGNRDILVGTVAVVLAGVISIIADFFLRMSFMGSNNDRGKGNPLIVIIAIVIAILAPIAATMIRLAISRKREFLADASGALLTRYPEGLASALEKISAHSQPMQKASHATAHLFLNDPFKGNGSGTKFLTKLFMTHPPIEERIAALRGTDKVA